MSDRNGGNDQTVERCENLIRSFLLRHPGSPSATEVDDYLQEAKIKLWQVLENGHDIEYLSAYIRKIVDSIVMNHLQRIVRERNLLASADWRILAENSAVRKREGDHVREMFEEVRTALDLLAGSRRTVLQMTMAGLSIHEIAATRKWTHKKTYNLYERGLKDLRKIFGDKGRRS